MQNNKRIGIEKISAEEIEKYILKVFEMYNCENNLDFIRNKYIFLFRAKYSLIEIVDKNEYINNVLQELGTVDLNPYSIGEPIIFISEENEVKPLLPFAKYLVKLCKNKLILKDKLIEKITYGKPVYLSNKIAEGYYLAMSEKGEFIAFVKVIIKNKKTKIIPLLDIGWYLRKGG